MILLIIWKTQAQFFDSISTWTSCFITWRSDRCKISTNWKKALQPSTKFFLSSVFHFSGGEFWNKKKKYFSFGFFHTLHSCVTVCKFQEFSSLWFFVKSMLQVQNLPFLNTYLESLKFGFYKFLPFLKAEVYHINKIHSPKKGKLAVFEILDSPNLISRKISMTEKSRNFHTVWALECTRDLRDQLFTC